jgi:ferrous iron transport protein A
MKTYCKLSALPLNETAEIYDFITDNSVTKRIRALGITEGAEIKPVFKSPFKDPVAYSVKGTFIALRKSESDEILVVKETVYE